MEQTATKWFYEFQTRIKKKIEESNYSRIGYIHYQIITKDKYIECWDLQHNGTGKITQMIFVCHKQTGIIFSYNSKDGI